MPYIDKINRRKIQHGWKAETAGELNYVLTMICKDYLEAQGEKYQTYNDIIGALEGAKLELYRRKTAAFEDRKAGVNGDVW
jgi:hypothetical protein